MCVGACVRVRVRVCVPAQLPVTLLPYVPLPPFSQRTAPLDLSPVPDLEPLTLLLTHSTTDGELAVCSTLL